MIKSGHKMRGMQKLVLCRGSEWMESILERKLELDKRIKNRATVKTAVKENC